MIFFTDKTSTISSKKSIQFIYTKHLLYVGQLTGVRELPKVRLSP